MERLFRGKHASKERFGLQEMEDETQRNISNCLWFVIVVTNIL